MTNPSDDLPAAPGSPIPGRGRPLVEFGLERLRESLVLRVCAVVAFMGYGGLVALALARKLELSMAGTVALLSLASWFFLLWWYPVLERTLRGPDRSARGAVIGNALEVFAILCVVLVHLLMAIIVVHSARS